MSTSRSHYLDRLFVELKQTIDERSSNDPEELEQIKLELELFKCRIFMEIVYQLEEIDDSIHNAPLLAIKKEDIESAATTLGATLGDALSEQ